MFQSLLHFYKQMNEERTPGESEWDVGSEVGGVLCGLQMQDTLKKVLQIQEPLASNE